MKFSYDLSDGETIGLKYPEAGLFSNEIKKTSSKQLMEEIFEFRQVKYISWNREDWVCTDCWAELIADTLPVWWATRRLQKMDGKDEV